jgi:hypothetical protein
MPVQTRTRTKATTETESTESFLPTALRTRLEKEKAAAAERAAAASGYLATPKDGESVEFRVMSPCRWGYEIWYDYKDDDGQDRRGCARWDAKDLMENGFSEPPAEEIPEGCALRKDGQPLIKTYMAMIVWNYREERFQIWSFTQTSLTEQFTKACENPRYGDPRGYDFEWSRVGKELKTRHTLMALPPAALDEEIKASFEEFECDLQAYCMGAPGEEVFGSKSEG